MEQFSGSERAQLSLILDPDGHLKGRVDKAEARAIVFALAEVTAIGRTVKGENLRTLAAGLAHINPEEMVVTGGWVSVPHFQKTVTELKEKLDKLINPKAD